MADTGYKSPSAEGKVYSDWSNPTNAYSSDNSRATGGYGYSQDYYNFNFGVPSGATIDGIAVSIEGYFSSSGTRTLYVKLWDGSSLRTSILNFSTGSEETLVAGSSTALWGGTWAADDFSDANFYVVLNHVEKPYNYSLDHIQVKVYYTEVASTSTSSSSTSSSTSTSSSSTSTTVSTSSSSNSYSSTSVSTSSTSSSSSSSSISSTTVYYKPEIKSIINNDI